MLESSVSLSRSFYFEDIIEPRVKDLGARRISGGSRRIWTATQIISAGLRPRQVWFCSQPQWTSQPSWMFAAFTVIACSVELTQRIKLTHQHVWHWSLNSQSLKITLNLSFLPPGNWCRKGKVKKIRDKRKKVLYVLVGTVQAKMVSSRLFLVRMVPGLCWASGWLVSSGGQVETGLSRMACFRS